MIYTKDFIWKEDHMAYHVTTSDNMKGISEKGLLPLCGDRSFSAHDFFKGIHFTDSLTTAIEDWMYLLYENKDKESLEVLRFNLKGLEWVTNYIGGYDIPGDWYLTHPLLPEYIEYLRILNGSRLEHVDLDNDIYYEEKNRVWIPIKEYKGESR